MNGIIFCLFNISNFSSTNNLEVMSKRTQEDAGEERVTANFKPIMKSRDAPKGIRMYLPLLHQKARGKPDMKVNYL